MADAIRTRLDYAATTRALPTQRRQEQAADGTERSRRWRDEHFSTPAR
jgi:hypothetical protein